MFAGCFLENGDGAKQLCEYSSRVQVVPLDVRSNASVRNARIQVEEKLAGQGKVSLDEILARMRKENEVAVFSTRPVWENVGKMIETVPRPPRPAGPTCHDYHCRRAINAGGSLGDIENCRSCCRGGCCCFAAVINNQSEGQQLQVMNMYARFIHRAKWSRPTRRMSRIQRKITDMTLCCVLLAKSRVAMQVSK